MIAGLNDFAEKAQSLQPTRLRTAGGKHAQIRIRRRFPRCWWETYESRLLRSITSHRQPVQQHITHEARCTKRRNVGVPAVS